MSSVWSQVNGDVLVVYFNDAKILDESKINQIHTELCEMVSKAESQKLLLNFQNVAFMSSAMIGKLILVYKKCKTDQVDLKFSNISPNIMEVFKIMKLNKMFEMHEDEGKALKSYEKKKGWFG
jgi:anti-sigma B factor antagonist